MKQRNPIAVFVFGIITLGIYSWYWAVKTKGEMNRRGEHVPTAWIWLIPFFGPLWWQWKYSEAVGHVTELDGVITFILLILLGNIGQAIVQNYFNKVPAQPASATTAAPAPEAKPAEPAKPAKVA